MLWMCLVWVDVLYWIDRVWSSKECACCACDPRVHLRFPSIGFVYVFCMSEVSSPFKSLRAGSQVFALRMLFLCVILHTMLSGKILQLLIINLVSNLSHQLYYVIETIQYLLERNTQYVYLVLLDSSKAFDRVSYDRLFNVLLERNMCPRIAKTTILYVHTAIILCKVE